MTDVALRLRPAPRPRFALFWALLAAIVIVLWLQPDLAAWAVKYPRAAVLPIAAWIGALMKWLIQHFQAFTRGIAAIIEVPLDVTFAVLAKGFTIGGISFPRFSWLGVTCAAAIIGHAAGGRRVAVISALCFLYIAVFGQWDSAMLTLALVLICVAFGVALGLLFGVLAYRSKRLDGWFIRPSLDLAQTMPAFAYLIPLLLLFGFGPVVGLIASAIYAIPPMVRNTLLGLEAVPSDIKESGLMSGCTPRQRFWLVEVPSAMPQMLVGINQSTMAAFSIVIIASIIGGFADIGWEVLSSMRQAQFGQSLLSGLVIALLAMVMDRITLGFAAQGRPGGQPGGRPGGRPQAARLRGRPFWIAAAGLLALAVLLRVDYENRQLLKGYAV